VEVVDYENVNMRVWERGAGETLACGTGCCATAVACVLNKRTGRDITVRLIGGDIKVRWDERDNHIYMTGPARTVFEGTYEF
jgi:diaminopimelate epimerase